MKMLSRDRDTSHPREDTRTAQEFSRRTLLWGFASAIGSTLASVGMREILQTKESGEDTVDGPHSYEELIDILQRELGSQMTFEQLRAHTEKEEDPEHVLMEASMLLYQALAKTKPTVENDEPEPVTCGIPDDYFANYQLSCASAEVVNPEKIDCNDRAYGTCEKLERHGIPMYLISIWPKAREDRLRKDWHQLAACKLTPDTYLIIDQGQNVRLWQGTLAQYFAEHTDNKMLPDFGCSKFEIPKHDHFVPKFVIQTHGSVPEDAMKQVFPHGMPTHSLIASR